MTGALAVALCASACGAPSTGSGSQAGEGGLTLLEIQELGNYNPLLGHGRGGASPVYESLYRVGPEEVPSMVPDLAAAAPRPSADLTSWTVPLREGVTFSDGTSFGPEDVVATYASTLDKRFASEEATDLDIVKSVEASGPHEVTFHLKGPFAEFDRRMLMGIAPSEAFANPVKASEMPLNSHPVGTGAYVLSQLRPDEAVFTARTDHRGGEPAVKKLVVRRVADESARAQQIRAGEGDGTMLESRLADAVGKDEHVEVAQARSSDWRGISMPTSHPVAGDPAVRMAANLAVDRKKMITDVYGGQGVPTSTFVAPFHGGAYDVGSEFPFDPAQAEKVLDDAGWVKGADGIRSKGGVRAAFDVIYYPNREAARKDLTLATATDLKRIGIEVNPVAMDSGAVTRQTYDTTPIMYGGGSAPYTVDGQIYKILHSRYADPKVGAKWDNASRYHDAAIDALLDSARVERNAAKRDDLYRQVQQVYRKNPALLGLTYGGHTYVSRDTGYHRTGVILEPHTHGVNYGPWYDLAHWTR